jgi:capsular polysaccharide biosynthesis protein
MSLPDGEWTRGGPDAGRESTAEVENEVDLLELFYELIKNIKYIILAAVVCTIVAGVYTIYFVTPMYEAMAKLYVMNSGESAINLSDLQIGTYLASDYQEVFKTWEVHEMVAQNLGLDYSYTEMQSMLSVSNPKDTRILYISVKSDDPKEAAAIANEYATVAKKYISTTMATEEPNVLSVALEPTIPVSPSKTRNIFLGFFVGALAAIAVIVIRFIMDDKIKSTEDIQKYTGMPTLAVIPVLNSTHGKGYAKYDRAPSGKGGRGRK